MTDLILGEIGKITYYVQYILIVTLVMTNFSEIIILIKDTVNSLVGFLNSLLPILLALMIATGNVVTASTIQPVLLLIITFVRKYYFICIFATYISRNSIRHNVANIRQDSNK